jgi:ABC transporter with metal-binding/Fe-S-binding domain ATP-binding protein
MRLAALFSGGKDSAYAIYRALQAGHTVECLVTMRPAADDSLLFHYPNSWVTEYQAQAMGIPLVSMEVAGGARVGKDGEVAALERAVAQARARFPGIEGVVSGGIASVFQKQAFEGVCARQGLVPVVPLWGVCPEEYMESLIREKFEVVIVGVSAMGLEKEWLGRTIDRDALAALAKLSKKYGFNLTFEGGEAETLVVDCPLFKKKRLVIKDAKVRWDGQRGTYEILQVSLADKK